MTSRKRRLCNLYLLPYTLTAILSTQLLCHATYLTQTVTSSVTQGGTQNLAEASIHVLTTNLRSYSYDQDIEQELTYIIPCSSDAVRTVMDTNEAMLAARALAKDGMSDVAWEMVQSVLTAQASNGFIPRYVYFDGTNSTKDDLWLQNSAVPNYPLFDNGMIMEEYRPVGSDIGVRGSGMLAASPFLSSIILDIFYLSPQNDSDEDILENLIESMYAWHEFLHSTRVQHGINIIHPWESLSQMDSPIWSPALLEAKEAVKLSGYEFTRGEIPEEVIISDNYPGDETYTAMLFLIDCLLASNTTDSNISKACPFTMADVGIASMQYQADVDLLSAADMLNDIKSKSVVSSTKTSQMQLWKDESESFLEGLWRQEESTSSYFSHYVDQNNGATILQVAVVENLLPLWRGWNNYLIAQNPDETPYSGEFRDIDDGKRLDTLTFQIIEGSDSLSQNAFGCNSSYWIRTHGCNVNTTDESIAVISPLSNYFLARGLELNGALGTGHYIRNTTINLACRLYPNSDGKSVEDCPLDPIFSNRFDVNSGTPRLNGYDFTCDFTSTTAAAVAFDLLFDDEPFEYDDGIPIASIWVTLLIAAELIIALLIMISCVLLSLNLMRSLKYDDDEMILRMLQDSRFQDQWGMRHEEANLIYGREFDDNAFDEQSNYRQHREGSMIESIDMHRNDNGTDVNWRDMFRIYAGYINPFRFKQPDGIARNNEGTLT